MNEVWEDPSFTPEQQERLKRSVANQRYYATLTLIFVAPVLSLILFLNVAAQAVLAEVVPGWHILVNIASVGLGLNGVGLAAKKLRG